MSLHAPHLPHPHVGRFLIAGVLGGLASLVPGISAGTMVLAAGVYPQLIGAISDLTAFRLRAASLFSLVATFVAALTALFLAAGAVRDAFNTWPSIFFALFLGLTVGGALPLWQMPEHKSRLFVRWAIFGALIAGVPLLIVEPSAAGAAAGAVSPVTLLIAGTASAFALVLPGISGSTLLVVTGLYLPYLNAVDGFTTALGVRPLSAPLLFEAFVGVAPFFLGMLLGIASAARLVQFLLARFRQRTLGALFGLLVGALVGLWPFQDVHRVRFTPDLAEVGIALAAILVGIAATLVLRIANPEARAAWARSRVVRRERRLAAGRAQAARASASAMQSNAD